MWGSSDLDLTLIIDNEEMAWNPAKTIDSLKEGLLSLGAKNIEHLKLKRAYGVHFDMLDTDKKKIDVDIVLNNK